MRKKPSDAFVGRMLRVLFTREKDTEVVDAERGGEEKADNGFDRFGADEVERYQSLRHGAQSHKHVTEKQEIKGRLKYFSHLILDDVGQPILRC